jgi:formylglycine-generating enzyme required for sulfatase activity/serine/threonine protein kinase
MDSEHRLALPKGTVINQYRIDGVLGYGGFGIVYKAEHIRLGNWLAIKEYLPQELATREAGTVHPLGTREQIDFQTGLDRFLAEAKQLVRFEKSSNIVNCQDFIEANGTAYLVMGFEDGLPLSDLIRGRERNNQAFSEDELLRIILPLLQGLAAVHRQNVLHRDIKPGNIFIRRDDEQPVLIDFGAAKQNFSEHSKSMAPYSPGYAAIEQVETDGNLGPWTDIYAIGGVMWRIIAKQNPPQVENRMSAVTRNRPDPMTPAIELGQGSYSDNLLKTIDRCLCLNEEDRIQTVEELISYLKGEELVSSSPVKPANKISDSAETSSASSFKPEQASASSEKSSIPKYAAFAVIAILVIVGGGYGYSVYQEGASIRAAEELAEQQRLEQEAADAAALAAEELAEQLRLEQEAADAADLAAAELAQQERQAEIDRQNETALNNAIAQLGTMITIPGGSFDMGDLSGTGDTDEAPAHTVFINSFQLMEHELTYSQWDACVQASVCAQLNGQGSGRRPLLPVTNASWDQVQTYIDWVNQQTGQGYRLPTEAEWEYAARAGTSNQYHWGNTHQCVLAKLDNCGEAGSSEVMSYAANDWGLYDMHGNAWEWVQDCARNNYNGAPDDGSVWDGSGGCSRILRGGGWDSSAYQGRISYRNWLPSNQSNPSSGIRLAR